MIKKLKNKYECMISIEGLLKKECFGKNQLVITSKCRSIACHEIELKVSGVTSGNHYIPVYVQSAHDISINTPIFSRALWVQIVGPVDVISRDSTNGLTSLATDSVAKGYQCSILDQVGNWTFWLAVRDLIK